MPRWSCPSSCTAATIWISPPISTAFRQFLMVIGPTAPLVGSWTRTSPPFPSTELSTPTPVTFLTGKRAYPVGGAQLRAPRAPATGGTGTGWRGATEGAGAAGAATGAGAAAAAPLLEAGGEVGGAGELDAVGLGAAGAVEVTPEARAAARAEAAALFGRASSSSSSSSSSFSSSAWAVVALPAGALWDARTVSAVAPAVSSPGSEAGDAIRTRRPPRDTSPSRCRAVRTGLWG